MITSMFFSCFLISTIYAVIILLVKLFPALIKSKYTHLGIIFTVMRGVPLMFLCSILLSILFPLTNLKDYGQFKSHIAVKQNEINRTNKTEPSVSIEKIFKVRERVINFLSPINPDYFEQLKTNISIYDIYENKKIKNWTINILTRILVLPNTSSWLIYFISLQSLCLLGISAFQKKSKSIIAELQVLTNFLQNYKAYLRPESTDDEYIQLIKDVDEIQTMLGEVGITYYSFDGQNSVKCKVLVDLLPELHNFKCSSCADFIQSPEDIVITDRQQSNKNKIENAIEYSLGRHTRTLKSRTKIYSKVLGSNTLMIGYGVGLILSIPTQIICNIGIVPQDSYQKMTENLIYKILIALLIPLLISLFITTP